MKCLYHSADLDGHCSGAIIKNLHPECEMIGINYGQDFPWKKIEQGEQVFMVDFGLQPFSDMHRLSSICELHWIDHHKSAIADAIASDFRVSGLCNVEYAGCELTWQYVNSYRPQPKAVRLLGRYDVWDHSEAETLPFQYGARTEKDTLPENQEFWNKLFTDNSYCDQLVEKGRLILDYEASQNTKFCKAYAFETELFGHKGICANRGFCNSKLFDSVYDPERHDLMISFSRLKPPAGKWTVSLYSTKDNVDCSVLAKQLGGGGHKGAAGFQCEELPFKI